MAVLVPAGKESRSGSVSSRAPSLRVMKSVIGSAPIGRPDSPPVRSGWA